MQDPTWNKHLERFTVSQDSVKRVMESNQSMTKVNCNLDEGTEFYLPQFED